MIGHVLDQDNFINVDNKLFSLIDNIDVKTNKAYNVVNVCIPLDNDVNVI